VIGSGFGGLAAAVRLGARGYRVTVVEKLDQPGGRARVFKQDGYTFDAGPTIITAPFVLDELWNLCGKKLADHVPLKRMDPFYRIRFDDGTYFACNDSAEDMRAQIAKFEPDDVPGYERFMADSKANYEVGFEKLGDKSFGSLWKMVKFVPWLAARRADRSVFSHVAGYIKNSKLRIALSFHPLFVGGNPLRVTSIYSLIAYMEREFGVHYAWGGTGSLVRGMVDLIEGQGGAVRLNAPVARLMIEDETAKGVVLESGEEIAADIVVSNADVTWTYDNLLPGRKAKRWSKKKLAKTKLSMSLFVWYFGTDKQFDDVDHHTILMGPRYKELLRDIFDRKVLADDFSLYLYRPSASDPSVAPEGCDAFYVLAPVPHLEGGVNWSEHSETYRAKIQKHLEDTIMPGLGDHVVTSRLMTPDDFVSDLNAPHGAAFGPEPIITQSAWFRPHNQSEEVANFYLVGAGTHPGAGVPSVITSAKVLDEIVPHGDSVWA
ncbi:MAG: phytoene desaturase, partial [Pseudomonadota bacterium]